MILEKTKILTGMIVFIMVIAFGHSQALGTNLSTSGTDSKSSQEHIGSQLTTNVEQEKITKTQETQTQHEQGTHETTTTETPENQETQMENYVMLLAKGLQQLHLEQQEAQKEITGLKKAVEDQNKLIQNLQQQAQLMLTMINGQQVAAVAAQSAANIANIAAKTEKSTDVPTTTELSGKTDSKTETKTEGSDDKEGEKKHSKIEFAWDWIKKGLHNIKAAADKVGHKVAQGAKKIKGKVETKYDNWKKKEEEKEKDKEKEDTTGDKEKSTVDAATTAATTTTTTTATATTPSLTSNTDATSKSNS